MRCDDHCGACCEVVPVTEEEYKRITEYAAARLIEPVHNNPFVCPYYQYGRCAVHEVKPLICQLFGHVQDNKLSCPRGYGTNAISDAEARARLLANGPPTRTLNFPRRK